MAKWQETGRAMRDYLTTHHLRPWVRWAAAALVVLALVAGVAWRSHRQALQPPHPTTAQAAAAGGKKATGKAAGKQAGTAVADNATGAKATTAAKKAAAAKAKTKAKTKAKATADAKKAAKTKAAKTKATADATPANLDWRAPSEDKPYPDAAAMPNLQIVVSLAKQRVYLKDGNRLVYTMYCSSGTDNTTPRGVFHIQAERGAYFYNAREKLGAHYYTSFLDHGVYLFHTVPTDASGHYIASEAAKLGKEPGSHGCVRLSVADAKWINEHIRVGTRVTIA
ncbi:L,D-transpeptidase [Lacticaseibacillus suihuaensis]